jgi:hypothetical protein
MQFYSVLRGSNLVALQMILHLHITFKASTAFWTATQAIMLPSRAMSPGVAMGAGGQRVPGTPDNQTFVWFKHKNATIDKMAK